MVGAADWPPGRVCPLTGVRVNDHHAARIAHRHGRSTLSRESKFPLINSRQFRTVMT